METTTVIIKPFLVTITRKGEKEPIPHLTHGCHTEAEAVSYIKDISPEGASGHIYAVKATLLYSTSHKDISCTTD